MTDADDPLREFLEVMRRLRRECDWKAGQSHLSLVRYLLEEAHETVEAIEAGDPAWLREELGDLLLQVYFHAVIAEESGEFTLDDVAADITAKMRRRNPHVFGDASAVGAEAVNDLWERVKADEKARASVTDGLPASLPALLYADKVLDRLSRAGEAAPPAGGGGQATLRSGEPVAQSPLTGALDPATDVGERLLALVAEARAAGVDPEQALRAAVRRRLPPG